LNGSLLGCASECPRIKGEALSGYSGGRLSPRSDGEAAHRDALAAACATWVAQAMIVIIGLTPTEVGSRLASAT
jgi:hypothetical protein